MGAAGNTDLRGLDLKAVLLIACLAVVGGCKEQPTTDQVEVADVNGRNALMRVAELTDRVDQLETDKSEIEDRFDTQRLENERLEAESNAVRSESDALNPRLN